MNVDSESSDTTENLNDVEKVLSKIGISIRKTNLEFKDFDVVLDEIADRWGTLDNVTKRAIANAFAGIRQQESILVLLNHYDKYKELLQTSENSAGTAERKYVSYQESLEAATNAFTASIEKFANQAEISELLRQGITALTSLVENWLPKIFTILPRLLIALEQGRSLRGNSLLQTALPKIIQSDTFSKLFGGFAGIGEGIKEDWQNATGTKAKIKAIFRRPLSAVGQLLLGETSEAKTAREGQQWLKFKEGQDAIDLLKRKQTLNDAIEHNEQAIQSNKNSLKLNKNGQPRKSVANTELQGKNALLEQQNEGFRQELEKIQQQEKALGQEKLKLANEEFLKEQQINTEMSKEVVKEKSKTNEGEQQVQNEREETQYSEQQVQNESKKANMSSSNSDGGSGEGSPTPGTNAQAAKMAAATAAITYGVGQIAQGVSAYLTAGVTHEDEYTGETVNSSEEARAKAREVATVWATAVPFIGSWIGEAVGKAAAKEIDAARDAANYQTAQAEKTLGVLNTVQNSLKTMQSVADSINPQDISNLTKAGNEYLSEMYKSENTETRLALVKELSKIYGSSVSLNQVIQDTSSENIKTRQKALHSLEIAQEKLALKQEKLASISERRAYQESIDKAYLQYRSAQSNYDKNGLSNAENLKAISGAAGVGTGVAGAVTVGGTLSAIAGALALGGSVTAATGVGLPIAAVLGIGAGILAGIATYNANVAEQQEQISEEMWNSMSLEEQLETLNEREQEVQNTIETTSGEEQKIASDTLAALKEVKDKIGDYQLYIQQKIDNENAKTISIALKEAETTTFNGLTTELLSELSQGQLKNLGLVNVYKLIAETIANDPDIKLNQVSPFYTDTNGNQQLSKQFIALVNKAINNSENDNLISLLSGESYTLQEAWDKFHGSTDEFYQKYLQNFADVLDTTIDQLEDFTGKFGEFTLAELIKTTSENFEVVDNYSELLDQLTSAEGSRTKVMQEILNKYPELTKYMSDTPTLIEHIVAKLGKVNELMLKSQWNEYITNSSYYENKVRPELFEAIKNNGKYIGLGIDTEMNNVLDNADTFQALLNSLNAYDLDKLRATSWNDITDNNEKVAKGLTEIIDQYGLDEKFNADSLIAQYKKYSDYVIKQKQKELDQLNAQKETLNEISKQREYELNLVKAKLKLEEAINKKSRVYRAGIGFVYESDQEAISEATKNLEEVQRTKEISELTLQAEMLQEEINRLNRVWENREAEGEAEAAQNIYDLLINHNGNNVFDEIISGITGASSTIGKQITNTLLEGQAQRDAKQQKVENAWNAWNEIRDKELRTQDDLEEYNSYLEAFKNAFTDAAQGGYLSDYSLSKIFGENKGLVEADSKLTKKRLQTYYGIGTGANTETLRNTNEDLSTKTTADIGLDKHKSEVIVYTQDDYTKGISGAKIPELKENEGLASYAERLYSDYGDKYNNMILEYNNKHVLFSGGEVYDLFSTSSFTQGSSGGNVSDSISFVAVTNTGIKNGGKLVWSSIMSKEAKLDAISKEIQKANSQAAPGEYVEYLATTNGFGSEQWYYVTPDGKELTPIEGNPTTGHLWGNTLSSPLTKEDKIKAILQKDSNGALARWLATADDFQIDKKYREIVLAHADGTYGINYAHYGLINELGTEAIITPSGTITALPSHTGIVPADITHNLWELGELAPSISRIIDAVSPMINTVPNNLANNSEEYFDIHSITINADETFDAEAFVAAIKSRALLTKNMH